VLPLLIVVFIVVPIAELYVIIQVGQAIGVLPTLALLLLDSIVGAYLLRSQGRTAWRRFNETMARGRIPANEAFDGVLIIFGGALLLTPGFLTDILGVLLLIPPSRAAVRALGRTLVARRMALGYRGAAWGYRRVRGRGAPPPGPGGPTGPAGPRTGPRPDDIEGTAHEIDDEGELPPSGRRGPRTP